MMLTIITVLSFGIVYLAVRCITLANSIREASLWLRDIRNGKIGENYEPVNAEEMKQLKFQLENLEQTLIDYNRQIIREVSGDRISSYIVVNGAYKDTINFLRKQENKH